MEDKQVYFSNIKVKENEVTLKYSETINDNDVIEGTFKAKDYPLESFSKALAELIPDVIQICEFPDEWKKELAGK